MIWKRPTNGLSIICSPIYRWPLDQGDGYVGHQIEDVLWLVDGFDLRLIQYQLSISQKYLNKFNVNFNWTSYPPLFSESESELKRKQKWVLLCRKGFFLQTILNKKARLKTKWSDLVWSGLIWSDLVNLVNLAIRDHLQSQFNKSQNTQL